MKRNIAVWILACLLFSLCACGAQNAQESVPATTAPSVETEPTEAAEPLVRDHLSVLSIGNSYSQDTTYYLYDAARAEGYQSISIGLLHIGGCTLQKHVKNASENLPAYKYFTNNDGEWKLTEACTIEYALESQPWDIIIIQQQSSRSGQPDTYEPYMTELINYVNEHKTNPNARIGWNMTWAYQNGYDSTSFDPFGRDQLTMYNAITQAVQQRVVGHEGIDFIIPCGTAVQNARTSFMGDTLNRDGTHLSVYGRVLCAYCWLATIEGQPLQQVTLTKVGTKMLMKDSEKDLIKESVNASMADPFSVTPSSQTAP